MKRNTMNMLLIITTIAILVSGMVVVCSYVDFSEIKLPKFKFGKEKTTAAEENSSYVDEYAYIFDGIFETTLSPEGGDSDKPEAYIIENVPFYKQTKLAKNGCESVAAVMALQYAGVDISVNEFIDKYLDKRYNYRDKSGQIISYSPEQYYINNPYDDTGIYCYERVIFNAINKFLDAGKYEIVDLTGTELSVLEEEYLCKDIPVVIWCTMYMGQVSKNAEAWKLKDTGEMYTPLTNSHCVVLTGYDSYKYYLNDSVVGAGYGYSREKVDRAYKGNGMRALAIYKKK